MHKHHSSHDTRGVRHGTGVRVSGILAPGTVLSGILVFCLASAGVGCGARTGINRATDAGPHQPSREGNKPFDTGHIVKDHGVIDQRVIDQRVIDQRVSDQRVIDQGIDAPPPTLSRQLDILFVIDNSATMDRKQDRLIAQFPELLAALHRAEPKGTLPDIHIGVVSTDVGAGPFNLKSCENPLGDNGRLQIPRPSANCKAPIDPWIRYANGKTNIPGCDGANPADGARCVEQAFACIAALGTEGCGFEQPLEAARRALDQDPGHNVNPGFIRPNARLAIIFLTDEDDCSAATPTLFDPQDVGINSPLGPLTSFRCFEFGVQCDVNDRHKVGPRKHCRPADGKWLHHPMDYAPFFAKLKPNYRQIKVWPIAGPAGTVSVGVENFAPKLMPICTNSDGGGNAVPAIRLNYLANHFGDVLTSICSKDLFTYMIRAVLAWQ
ncbi:MAG: hypothetical protein JRH20_08235 [Deltaproteobacteria bacterium]|nr:hypothetical protein [Deltaproteobacteria bacterium]